MSEADLLVAAYNRLQFVYKLVHCRPDFFFSRGPRILLDAEEYLAIVKPMITRKRTR